MRVHNTLFIFAFGCDQNKYSLNSRFHWKQ